MGRTAEPDFAAIEEALRNSDSPGEPAEIHGEYCGLACLMGSDSGPAWVTSVLADMKRPAGDVRDVLQSLSAATWRALEAGDMELALLLPDDDELLEKRAESLGLWCQGFMHGLGVGSKLDANSPQLTEGITQEIIADFSEITRAAFSADETEAEAEAAYVELVEFVRVSVQLAFEELYRLRTAPGNSPHH